MDSRILFIDRETFETRAKQIGGAHWDSFELRWAYFKKTIEFLSTMPLRGPSGIMEAGTNGVPVVLNADTLDYSQSWNYEGKHPTYVHDMRMFPWPISAQQYEVFIALRVWHHLGIHQEACFREAKRISKHLILVIPEASYTGYGVSPETVAKWNDDAPVIVEDVGEMGKLYFISPVRN